MHQRPEEKCNHDFTFEFETLLVEEQGKMYSCQVFSLSSLHLKVYIDQFKVQCPLSLALLFGSYDDSPAHA